MLFRTKLAFQNKGRSRGKEPENWAASKKWSASPQTGTTAGRRVGVTRAARPSLAGVYIDKVLPLGVGAGHRVGIQNLPAGGPPTADRRPTLALQPTSIRRSKTPPDHPTAVFCPLMGSFEGTLTERRHKMSIRPLGSQNETIYHHTSARPGGV